jgi:two-component system phosphate regulon response regulator OmpR
MTQPADDAAPHILVVDDDTRLRGLLGRYLTDNGYRVSVAVDAADARQKLGSMVFDLLILDRMMPGEGGADFARSLRRLDDQRGRVPILMLTAMAEVEDRIDGLEHGADDYLTKPFEPRELLLRIGAILRRTRTMAMRCVRFGEFEFNIERGELTQHGEPVYLTSGETTMLRILAANAGHTVSREALSEESERQIRAVDVQMTRLRRKIESDPRLPRHIHTVRGEGYILWAD